MNSYTLLIFTSLILVIAFFTVIVLVLYVRRLHKENLALHSQISDCYRIRKLRAEQHRDELRYFRNSIREFKKTYGISDDNDDDGDM